MKALALLVLALLAGCGGGDPEPVAPQPLQFEKDRYVRPAAA